MNENNEYGKLSLTKEIWTDKLDQIFDIFKLYDVILHRKGDVIMRWN